MDKDSALRWVIDRLEAEHMVKRELTKPDSALISDLHLDSLDRLELVMAMEDVAEREIPDTEAESFKTVADLVEWLEKASVTQ